MMTTLEDAHYEFSFHHRGLALSGKVYRHPWYPDGTIVHTSKPRKFNQETGEIVTNSGTKYKIESYLTSSMETTIKRIVEDCNE